MTTEPDPPEVEQLRLENEKLRADLAAADAGEQRVSRRRFRRAVASVLAFATALLLVLGAVATWTSRTALDTNKFVERVGPVIEDPTVRAAVATELSDQLITALNLQSRLANALPTNLTFLSGPLAGGMDDVVRKQVTKFVDSQLFTKVWLAALRLSHQAVVKTLTGNSSSLQVVNGKVIVDLIPVIQQVLANLQSQLPTMFGTAVSLQIPDNLPVAQIRSLVEQFLGVQLPPSFAEIPIMNASDLENARTGVRVINLSVILVLLGALLALVLALLVSVNRRRTLLQTGLWTAIITATVFFVLRTLTDQAIAGVGDATLRPAVTAGVRELFSSLRGWAAILFWTGLLLALVLYLAGPGRFPRALRGWVVSAWSWSSGRVRAVAADEGIAGWVARNLDPLRIGGVVLAALLLIWLSSWTALAIIGVLLVLFEVGVTLYARSTPLAAAEAEAVADGLGEDPDAAVATGAAGAVEPADVADSGADGKRT